MARERLDSLAAKCVVAGIQGLTPTEAELDLVRRGIGGIVLFARNVQDPEQVATLCKTLKAAAPGKLLIAIDQEGGRVQRLKAPHWTTIPTMGRLGDIDHAGGLNGLPGHKVVEKVGQIIASELNACGIDWNLAPVVDIASNPDNPVIGDRSFGDNETRVSKLAAIMGQTFERNGIASCAKHFPGHGDTSQDSHKTLPRLAHDEAQLWECELVPFLTVKSAMLASVMTAHVTFDALDTLPATLSERTLRILRKDIGFAGVCVSDDLEMAAIADNFGVLDSAPNAIAAGCDAVLICHTLKLQDGAIDGISRAARSGPLAIGRLEQAAARMDTLQKFAKSAASIDPSKAAAACGTAASRAFIETIEKAELKPHVVHRGFGQAHVHHDPTERSHA
ncbi:MAG: beta-N-acetylhexosaminidase [Deltaproteobacteria bacterium]|nr:beta-N-acetylhexosaminidase [Deltaproteobacteria bacterium]